MFFVGGEVIIFKFKLDLVFDIFKEMVLLVVKMVFFVNMVFMNYFFWLEKFNFFGENFFFIGGYVVVYDFFKDCNLVFFKV